MATRRIPFDDLTRLAAAHAALDPQRVEWRSDILISSLIEILAVRGVLDERQLLNQVKKMWHTDVVDKRLLRVALERAEKGDLLERKQRLHGPWWVARPASIADAKADRMWADSIIERFKQDLGERLPEFLDDHGTIEPTQQRDYTHYLIDAFMAGSQRVFKGVVRSGDPENLSGIDFDLQAVHGYLETKNLPKDIENALKALALTAMESEGEFGSEILHLIVAGQVLQGMIGHRDLTGPNWVEGCTLVLDTSVLVYRLDHKGPQSRLLDELLRMSQDIHCNIVATRAVINEWNRLWQSAASDARAWANKFTDLPPRLILEAKNPMLRNWQFKTLTWTEFERRFNRIESWLADHGIRVVEDEQADQDLVERMREELLRLSAAAKQPMRTESAALTDAVSAAIVAKARALNSSLPPTAWFIAEDRFTDEAYRGVWPDDNFPVASSIEEWLLLLSMTKTDELEEAGNVAETISNAVIQKSFFSVSAGYSAGELFEIGDLLKRGSDEDREALAADVRTDIVALAKLSSTDVPAELLRRRAIRRDWQVQRREREVNARTEEMDNRVQKAEERVKNLQTQNIRMRRTAWLLIALFIMASMVGAAAALGAHIWLVVGGAILCVGVGSEGFRWRYQQDVRPLLFIIGIVAAISWVVLGGLIPMILS
jgi:hypothetical protein